MFRVHIVLGQLYTGVALDGSTPVRHCMYDAAMFMIGSLRSIIRASRALDTRFQEALAT